MMNPILLFVAALLIVWIVLQTFGPREKFQPEFLDTTQVTRTIAAEDSSYAQRTNHATPAQYNMGPIAGVQSPWQVNQYRSYIK
jgi:hypothetical protein